MQRKAKSLYANTRSVMLNVRVTPALKAKLEQMAREDHRTVSNLVELILERACDAERKRWGGACSLLMRAQIVNSIFVRIEGVEGQNSSSPAPEYVCARKVWITSTLPFAIKIFCEGNFLGLHPLTRRKG
jgi:hypothetical protein